MDVFGMAINVGRTSFLKREPILAREDNEEQKAGYGQYECVKEAWCEELRYMGMPGRKRKGLEKVVEFFGRLGKKTVYM